MSPIVLTSCIDRANAGPHAPRRRNNPRSFRWATISLMCLSTGCGNLTQVTNDTITQPEQLANPVGASEQMAGAVRDFANDLGSQAFWTGVLTDEMTYAVSQPFVDQRAITPQLEENGFSFTYPYSGLVQARLEALLA